MRVRLSIAGILLLGVTGWCRAEDKAALSFSRVDSLLGVSVVQSTYGPTWGDFDRDGYCDVFVGNHGAAPSLFHNEGAALFNDRQAQYGLLPGDKHGAAWGDYDNDGFLDLYVTNGWDCHPFNLGPHVIYRNEGNANRWLRVRLVGVTSNRDGIGASVRLVAGGQVQHRIQTGAVHGMSQSCMDLHFGLGAAAVVDTLLVTWPDGLRERYTGLAAGQIHVCVQGSTLEAPEPGAGGPGTAGAHLWTPNPQPPGAPVVFHYRLAESGPVTLAIHDAAGRRLRVLEDREAGRGTNSVCWDGRDAGGHQTGAGTYYAHLRAGPAECICRVTWVW